MHDEDAKETPQGREPPREERGNLRMDDINIPMVATGVVFFAVVLGVMIIALQAWFYNKQASERQRKLLPQEDARTELGALLQRQREELQVAPGTQRAHPRLAVAATEAAPGTVAGTTVASTGTKPEKLWIPIETAMKVVARQYGQEGMKQ